MNLSTPTSADVRQNTFYRQHLISARSLTLNDILLILSTARAIKDRPTAFSIANKIVANCFFEPSTRTRLSFETAALRLGGNVIGFANETALSVKKGETLSDTVRMLSTYADLIVLRHPNEGAATLAAEVATCPVINAGDGANQHPTQALLDLFTIQECQQKLNGLSIALVGDLKYGRTIHSLIDVLAWFDVRLYLVSPELLTLPDTICDRLKKRGTPFSFHRSVDEIISKVDVLYMTRIQQERFTPNELALIGTQCVLTTKHLEKAKSNLKILHPLPRLNELPTDIDKTPYAHYFQQAENGVLVRQALLSLILNETQS